MQRNGVSGMLLVVLFMCLAIGLQAEWVYKQCIWKTEGAVLFSGFYNDHQDLFNNGRNCTTPFHALLSVKNSPEEGFYFGFAPAQTMDNYFGESDLKKHDVPEMEAGAVVEYKVGDCKFKVTTSENKQKSPIREKLNSFDVEIGNSDGYQQQKKVHIWDEDDGIWISASKEPGISFYTVPGSNTPIIKCNPFTTEPGTGKACMSKECHFWFVQNIVSGDPAFRVRFVYPVEVDFLYTHEGTKVPSTTPIFTIKRLSTKTSTTSTTIADVPTIAETESTTEAEEGMETWLLLVIILVPLLLILGISSAILGIFLYRRNKGKNELGPGYVKLPKKPNKYSVKGNASQMSGVGSNISVVSTDTGNVSNRETSLAPIFKSGTPGAEQSAMADANSAMANSRLVLQL